MYACMMHNVVITNNFHKCSGYITHFSKSVNFCMLMYPISSSYNYSNVCRTCVSGIFNLVPSFASIDCGMRNLGWNWVELI